MVRFFYVIIMNLYRLYMIPRMRFRANHPEWFKEESRYRYAQHMIQLMKKTGRIHTKAFGQENLQRFGTRRFFCADELYIRAGRPLPEADYFLEHFIPAFEKTLDELGSME